MSSKDPQSPLPPDLKCCSLHKRDGPAKLLRPYLPRCHPPPHRQTPVSSRPSWRSPVEASCPNPARQSPSGRAGTRKPPDSGRRALTRASSRATPVPPLPPALAAGQLAARVLEERVREEMKWLLPPVAPGSAPAPGPGPGPGDLDPRRRRELFRVFTMVQPEGRGPRRARESRGRPARRPDSQGRWSRAGIVEPSRTLRRSDKDRRE